MAIQAAERKRKFTSFYDPCRETFHVPLNAGHRDFFP